MAASTKHWVEKKFWVIALTEMLDMLTSLSSQSQTTKPTFTQTTNHGVRICSTFSLLPLISTVFFPPFHLVKCLFLPSVLLLLLLGSTIQPNIAHTC